MTLNELQNRAIAIGCTLRQNENNYTLQNAYGFAWDYATLAEVDLQIHSGEGQQAYMDDCRQSREYANWLDAMESRQQSQELPEDYRF